MNYFKYISDETKTYFSVIGKALGAGVLLILLVGVIFDVKVSFTDVVIALLGVAITMIGIWAIYAIIEYFHYRKFKRTFKQ